MKRRTRRILFWLAVVIFGTATWVAVLMAQGYKYDFSRNVFVRTGAIALTANTDSQLYVNDRPAAPMSFLTHRTGMDHLLPGTYSIRVAKEGYSGWHKTVTVQEGLLTDFPSVLLIPLDRSSSASVREEITLALAKSVTVPKKSKEISAGQFTLRGTTLLKVQDGQETAVAENVLGVALTENSSRIMWWTRNELWVLWLANTDYQPFHITDDRQLITRFSVPIVRAAWFRDNDHLAVDLGGDGYRVVEIDTRGGTNITKI